MTASSMAVVLIAVATAQNDPAAFLSVVSALSRR
jgi:hypothetical protein